MRTTKQKSEERRNYILEGNLPVVIVTIAIPQVVTMLIDSFYNMADAFFVSRIGDAAIAAVGVNDSLMMILRAISMCFAIGSASFISRALGAKRDKEASQAAVTTLFTAMGVLSISAVLGSVFLPQLVNFLGVTDTVRPYSMQYARWILISAPVTGATTVLAHLLRAEGSTVYSMLGISSGCLVNVVLDPIFIYNLNMGVAGAAIATGISKVCSMLILFVPFIRGKCVIRLKPSLFTPTKAIYGEIARMGIPTMMRTGMMSISTILINNMAASFSDAVMASISVANKSLRMVHSAVMGFGQGFQPVAGYSYGAKKYGRVLDAYRIILTIGAVGGLTLGGALALLAPQIIEMFSGDPGVKELGLILIRTQSATMVFHMWVMVTSGFFQALGKAVKAGIMGLSRQLFVLIPCVLILSRLFGPVGLASSQAVTDVIALILAAFLVVPTVKEIRALQKKNIEIEHAEYEEEGA